MLKFRHSMVVHRSLEEVFKLLATDYFENRPRWDPAPYRWEKTSEGPMRAGATGRAVSLQQDRRGRYVVTNFVVTEYEQNKLVTFRGSPAYVYADGNSSVEGKDNIIPVSFRRSYDFEPSGDATRINIEIDIEAAGLNRLRQFLLLLQAGDLRRENMDVIDHTLEWLEGSSKMRTARAVLRRFSPVGTVYVLALLTLYWVVSSYRQLGISGDSAEVLGNIFTFLATLGIMAVVVRIFIQRAS